jgi:type IV secretory pathway protease TraF
VPLTRVALAYIEPRFKLYLRFGEPARTLQLDRWRRCAVFLPGAMFCRIRWQANDYGTIRWQLMVMQACTPLDARSASPACSRARLLLHAEGDANVRAVLERIDGIEALGIAPSTCRPRTGARWATARGAPCAARIHRRAARRLAGREGAAMTPISTTAPRAASSLAPARSHRAGGLRRRRPRCAGLGGFRAPLPRLTYNPSDSVAVGWYRIEPFDPRTASLPRPLSVDSIVLVPLPARAAALAAQRGYLPTRVPLLKRVGAVAPQHVCIVAGQVRIDGVPAAVLPADRLGRPLPSLQLCRRLEPGELFLLSVTNPASFDSRYFGRSAHPP